MTEAVNDTISSKARVGTGKSVTRKLRAAGEIPSVVYGPGSDMMNLSIDAHKFSQQRSTFRRSHLFNMEVEGKDSFKALVRDIQRNPVTDQYLHIDFYAVDMNKPLRVEIVIVLDGKSIGVAQGGQLTQRTRMTEIECLPADIPPPLSVDITDLDIGDTIYLRDIKLPKGVEFVGDTNDIVVNVIEFIEEEEETTETEEGAEVAAAAEGEATEEAKD